MKGTCLCGAVVFEVDEVGGALELCHCSRCRKTTGSGFAAGLQVRVEQYRLLSGAEVVRYFELPVRDAAPAYGVFFCGNCGSPVPDPTPTGRSVEVPAGALDGPLGRPVDRHIYVEHRADWVAGLDDLPSYTGAQIRSLRATGTIVPTLCTERLILRPWIDEDFEPFAQMNADPRVMEFFVATLSREQSDALATRIRTHLSEKGWGLWAVEVPGQAKFIGFAGLAVPTFDAHFMPCVEIGWRLATAHWGRGYGTEAARAVLDFAFTELGVPEVLALTTVANERSRRVMDKLGMTHDPTDDFDHPNIAAGHALKPHVVYRLLTDAPLEL